LEAAILLRKRNSSLVYFCFFAPKIQGAQAIYRWNECLFAR